MSPRRPRALLVSWLFPPHGSIGAKRAYRFARHIPAHGWDVTVLCGREPPARWQDPSPLFLPPSVERVADYDAPWLTRFANTLDDRASRAPKATGPAASSAHSAFGSVRAAVASVARDLIPTETIAAHLPHALGAAAKITSRQRIDLVWTTSYPYSAHLVGVALKRRCGIPFVADLRDPWTPNFVHRRKLAPARWVERCLENLVFAHADRVTVTTEALADEYRRQYPRHAFKFVTVRNGFDPTELPARCPAPGPVRVVHFGHVYSERTLAEVYGALALLRARGLIRPGALVLENYGRLSDRDRALIAKHGIDDLVHVSDPIPYTEGLARLRQADLLLLPAWGTPQGALFLPGKLYDYLLAGAPILAIGRNTELSAILTRTRAGVLMAPGDTDGVAGMIAAALEGQNSFAPDFEAISEFSAPRATARLVALFNTLISP